MKTETEHIGEEPHLDPEMVAIVRRAVRELRPTVHYSNGNGYKLAFILLGVLVSICMGLSAWTLAAVVDLKVQMATISQCISDKTSCEHAVYRGAVIHD